MTISKDYARGAKAAAEVADGCNGTTTHGHRLGDCILGKLNLRKPAPRRNTVKIAKPAAEWMRGVAVALAEVHRHSHDSTTVVRVAKACGLTLAVANMCKVAAYDLRILRRAGVK